MGEFSPIHSDHSETLLSFEPGSSLPMQMSVPGFQAALSLIQWVMKGKNGKFTAGLVIVQILPQILQLLFPFWTSYIAALFILSRFNSCIQWERQGAVRLLHLTWN